MSEWTYTVRADYAGALPTNYNRSGGVTGFAVAINPNGAPYTHCVQAAYIDMTHGVPCHVSVFGYGHSDAEARASAEDAADNHDKTHRSR